MTTNGEPMDETLETPKTAIAEYTPTAAALAQLAHRFKGVVFDVTTSKGNGEARSARKELVSLRTTLEAKRVELKAPALERSRLIDAEAKRITSEITALEKPIDDQIKAEEQRKEAERQAKVAAEMQRVAEIQARINDIRSLVLIVSGGSREISTRIRQLEDQPILDGNYEEFTTDAAAAKNDTLAKLREMRDVAVAREAEQERLKVEREELERLRAADEQRRVEEEQRAAAARAEEAAKLKAEREAFEREQLEAHAERERETARLNTEREELRRQQKEATAAATAITKPAVLAGTCPVESRGQPITVADAITWLSRRDPLEPCFTVVGSDPFAPSLVERWCGEVATKLGWSHPKIFNAEATALAMSEWPTKKHPD